MYTTRIKLVLCFLFIIPVHTVISQGKINVPAIECLGNVTQYSYTPPSGLTLSAAVWNFGDGFTSNNLTPSHTYVKAGKFSIVIQATFTNSSTRTDSVKIEVVNLPKAGFYMDTKTDSCLHRNKVCYFDTSRPAINGQSIKERLFVWGDGTIDTMNNPVFGQKICHEYAKPDKYDLRMEVTDIHGCKNSRATQMNIIDDIASGFKYKHRFVNCTTSEVCVYNISWGDTARKGFTEWYIDTLPMDTTKAYSGFLCKNLVGSRSSTVRMITYITKTCKDTTTVPLNLLVDSIPKSMELLDTVLCFSDNSVNEAYFKPVSADTIYWYIDNGYDPYKVSNHIYFESKLMPGIHQIKADIIRGYCTTSLVHNYTVIGPFGKIRAVDADQCQTFSSRQIFFMDESVGADRKNCTFFWNISDAAGESCTNSRSKNINTYKNCNYATDWYTKHKFNDKTKSQYTISMYIQDTVSGCGDTALYILNMENCGPLLAMDSLVICQGNRFVENTPPPFPYQFTIDSANQKWMDFMDVVDSPYLGNYTTGLIYKTIVSPWIKNIGNDSIEIHKDTAFYYDTAYLQDWMHIKEKKTDSIWATLYGNCKPLRLSLHFKKGIFNDGDSISIDWAIGTRQGITFNKTTTLDSIMHTYNTTGIQEFIRVILFNKYRCSTEYRVFVEKGKLIAIRGPLVGCIKTCASIGPGVYDIVADDIWTRNTSSRRVKWQFDDTTGEIHDFFVCYRFKTPGPHTYKLMTSDSFGCLDTVSRSIFIQDPKANVKNDAKFIYCSEIKQFFDSSSIMTINGDVIDSFLWRFGSGSFSSVVKDPVQSINTSLDKIPAAHYIKTHTGCYDTFYFDIKVIGPKPYFLIRDTIGCGSLNAEFVNLSRDCKKYIWEFGDPGQTTKQVSDKNSVNFLYDKPGRYFINLIGIDSVYNPFTRKTQYCSITFPDKTYQKDTTRSVLVLPYYTTGISGKDTVCLGSPAQFLSKSDTAYDFDTWDLGDSSFLGLAPGTSVSHTYNKTGLYSVKLKPGFNTSLDNLCRDSAEKSVLVIGVNADFDIDPLNVPPVFLFHNKSNPSSANIKWDFGQPGSGSSNFSSDNNPSHNYDKDTGTFEVCLIATLPQGCADTTCKTVFNDFQEAFGIYNVFTPGLMDGKNDQYDIVIENEKLYELFIYDRWGRLVYEGKEDSDNTQNVNWNGKVFNKGAECPGGTYYYIFRYSLRQKPDDIITINGTITLIR